MKAFYGDRISPNQTKTPEGFLICHNVNIARTGTQDYLPKEIGESGNGLIHVHRLAQDVFAPSALSSFEGKPVTDDHPPQEVNPTNYGVYTRGVVQNVRRNGEYMTADLVIHDAKLISEIESGKREISCGYECNYVKDDKGDYKQTNIIGNHVAVVSQGRAGATVSIKDQKPIIKGRNLMKKSIFQRMFESFVKDAEPEEILEASEAVKDAEKDGETCDEDVTEKEKPSTTDEDVAELAKTVDSLSRTVERLAYLQLSSMPKRKTVLDELEEELTKDEDGEDEDEAKEDVEDEGENETSRELPPEEIDEDVKEDVEVEDEDETEEEKPVKAADKAVALAAIRAVKPIIASLPVSQRKKANDAMNKAIRKALKTSATQPLNGGYGALIKRTKTADSAKAAADLRAFGENCRKRNPHLK